MAPTNVGKIFNVPLKELRVDMFTYIMHVYMHSIDLE